MDLIISGRSEGLAAASAINDFMIREGTVTCVLQTHLMTLPALSLPFDALGIYVEAIDHTKPSGLPIAVNPQKKLVRFRSGQSQEMYEITIGNSYYQLDAPARREAICNALLSIAESLDAEFPSAEGRALAGVFAASPRPMHPGRPTVDPSRPLRRVALRSRRDQRLLLARTQALSSRRSKPLRGPAQFRRSGICAT